MDNVDENLANLPPVSPQGEPNLNTAQEKSDQINVLSSANLSQAEDQQPVQSQTAPSPQPGALSTDQPQSEEKTGSPSVLVNYVSQSQSSDVQVKEKSQRIVFALALFLFLISLVGLILYFVSAWKGNRIGGTKFVTPSPEVVQTPEAVITPTSSPKESTSDWQTFQGATFVFKYPSDLMASKEGDFIVLTSSEGSSQPVVKLRISDKSNSKDLLTVLTEEAKKINSKTTLEEVKNTATFAPVGSYTLFSYSSQNEKDPVFFIFDDAKSAQTVFILDYSKGGNLFENLVSNIVSSFEFLKATSLPLSSTPTASPSAKFNIGE